MFCFVSSVFAASCTNIYRKLTRSLLTKSSIRDWVGSLLFMLAVTRFAYIVFARVSCVLMFVSVLNEWLKPLKYQMVWLKHLAYQCEIFNIGGIAVCNCKDRLSANISSRFMSHVSRRAAEKLVGTGSSVYGTVPQKKQVHCIIKSLYLQGKQKSKFIMVCFLG